MKTSNNTILITGGTNGIGLELAKQFLKLGNTVIVTGRDQARLDEAEKKLPDVHAIQSDASDPKAIMLLYEKVTDTFPDLNVVINNAGIMKKINFHDKDGDLSELTREIEINLMGPIRMVKKFLPHLKSKKSAAIVNVSSGLAFVPLPIAPIYCAAKAAIHSFTQSLRIQLKNTNVKVFELAPPAVETTLLRTGFEPGDLKGAMPMDVESLAKLAIAGIEEDIFEIPSRPQQYVKNDEPPRAAVLFLNQMGKSVDGMLAKTKN